MGTRWSCGARPLPGVARAGPSIGDTAVPGHTGPAGAAAGGSAVDRPLRPARTDDVAGGEETQRARPSVRPGPPSPFTDGETEALAATAPPRGVPVPARLPRPPSALRLCPISAPGHSPPSQHRPPPWSRGSRGGCWAGAGAPARATKSVHACHRRAAGAARAEITNGCHCGAKTCDYNDHTLGDLA